MEEESRGSRFFHPQLFGAITISLLGVFIMLGFGSTSALGDDAKQVQAVQAPLPSSGQATVTPIQSEPTVTPTSIPSPTPSLSPIPTVTPIPTATPTPSPSPTPIPTANAEDTAVWDKLAQCEAGGNWAEDTGNGYYGGLQFNQTAWNSVGGSGKPSDASRDEQILRGKTLQAQRGWSAWGECGKKLGLY